MNWVKPLPCILTGVLGELMVMDVGKILVIVGTTKLPTARLSAEDVPPPGAPVATVTCIDDGLAMSVGVIPACRTVELT